MRSPALWLLVLLAGCGGSPSSGPVGVDPREAPATASSGATADGAPAASPSLPEPTCAGTPAVGPAGPWRHSIKSPVIAALGDPRHRGIDLVIGAGAATQPIRGEIKYGGDLDKSLEDETVELWACRAGAWQPLGSALTDDEGRFELDLSGSDRLPVGLRPMFVSVVGDRTSATFLALVAPDGSELAASDVDGTLTTSENAFAESLVTGAAVDAWPGAPDALATLQTRRYIPVYLTARGRTFTQATRDWLAAHKFPLGPVHLADAIVTLPGSGTVDYKAGAMAEWIAGGLVVGVGVGNRASDGEAYARAKVPATQTYLELPEFATEVQPLVDAHQAVGFSDYTALAPTLAMLPLAP